MCKHMKKYPHFANPDECLEPPALQTMTKCLKTCSSPTIIWIERSQTVHGPFVIVGSNTCPRAHSINCVCLLSPWELRV